MKQSNINNSTQAYVAFMVLRKTSTQPGDLPIEKNHYLSTLDYEHEVE